MHPLNDLLLVVVAERANLFVIQGTAFIVEQFLEVGLGFEYLRLMFNSDTNRVLAPFSLVQTRQRTRFGCSAPDPYQFRGRKYVSCKRCCESLDWRESH